MPTTEKRRLLAKEIQEVPDDRLDELLIYIQQLKNQKSDSITETQFEQILYSTSDQYQEVWKALA